MLYRNLSELKNAASEANTFLLKSLMWRTRLHALYEHLYTNADYRLNLLADKIRTIYPSITEERIKNEMTLWEIISILRENPPQQYTGSTSPLLSTPSKNYLLYLSVIFEIVFLPLYIAKDN